MATDIPSPDGKDTTCLTPWCRGRARRGCLKALLEMSGGVLVDGFMVRMRLGPGRRHVANDKIEFHDLLRSSCVHSHR
ncbi:MAG: hypothetical protein OXC69_07715 [Candidatus Tectomicrobia bacterium]|nr:hypothetical protein [Candidatus Tectomicrobia bacterium]